MYIAFICPLNNLLLFNVRKLVVQHQLTSLEKTKKIRELFTRQNDRSAKKKLFYFSGCSFCVKPSASSFLLFNLFRCWYSWHKNVVVIATVCFFSLFIPTKHQIDDDSFPIDIKWEFIVLFFISILSLLSLSNPSTLTRFKPS